MPPNRLDITTARKNALAYSLTTLAATMMDSIYQFYYVKVYHDLYKITPGWFNFAQGLFMVWNAINDPLFGWLQDKSKLKWLNNRRLNILYGAPLFVLSFLMPWFPNFVDSAPIWVRGLHLTFSLCFYDSMYTFVVLAQSALSAELSLREADRVRLVKYSQISSLIGSMSIFCCQYVSWNALSSDKMKIPENTTCSGEGFSAASASDHRLSCNRSSVEVERSHDLVTAIVYLQVFNVFVAMVSYLALRYSAMHMHPAVTRSEGTDASNPDSPSSDGPPFMVLLRQILSNRNFLLFVAMNFCQIFHMTFRSNFFATFADHLLGDAYGPTALVYLAGMAYVVPQLILLLSGRWLAKFGSYWLIQASFVSKFVLALLMLTVGRYQYLLLAFFFVVDRSIAQATFSLFNLSLSDVIDEDFKKYSRRFHNSSMVFGLNAFFTKPAQSLAPILVVNYLVRFDYSSGPRTALESSPEKLHSVQGAMFNLLVFLPLILSVIQMVLWKFYKLRTPPAIKMN